MASSPFNILFSVQVLSTVHWYSAVAPPAVEARFAATSSCFYHTVPKIKHFSPSPSSHTPTHPSIRSFLKFQSYTHFIHSFIHLFVCFISSPPQPSPAAFFQLLHAPLPPSPGPASSYCSGNYHCIIPSRREAILVTLSPCPTLPSFPPAVCSHR